MMTAFDIRGEKRKGEDDDDGYRRKMRIVEGGVVKAVAEEEEEMAAIRNGASGHVGCGDAAHLPCSACEVPAKDSDYLQETHEELIGKVHAGLENLTFVDSSTPPAEGPDIRHAGIHEDFDWSWLESVTGRENRCHEGRRHSDSSARLAHRADASAGELPDGSGRRSAPPSLTSPLTGCSSLACTAAISNKEPPNKMFELHLNLSLDELPEPGVEEAMTTKAEVEQVEIKAEMDVAVETLLMATARVETLEGLHAEDELDQEQASTTTETLSELRFRLVDTEAEQFDNAHIIRPCFRQRLVNAEDLAGRIRGLRMMMMDRLGDIERALKPHCSGAGWG